MCSQFLCSSVQQAVLSLDCWGDKDLWYLHSFVISDVQILPNPKQGVWFPLSWGREIWKIYLYFPINNLFNFIKKTPVIKSFMVYRCISKYFFCVKQSNSQFFFHFIISTCSHLIFIFLEKILASSRRELKTQHWLIYQDNSSSAVSQCHNDLNAQDLCCIVYSDLLTSCVYTTPSTMALHEIIYLPFATFYHRWSKSFFL